MKTLMNLAAVCLCVAIIGCESSQSTTAPANMGAVGECGTNCATECATPCGEKASMGVVGDAQNCASSCSGKADLGAVSDAPSCSEKAAECEAVCPMSGKVSDTSLGAVSESSCSSKKKSSCASSCSGK